MAHWKTYLPQEPVTLLVAVSGGADSVFLLHHVHEEVVGLGHQIVVAHVNHGLRGEESDGDEEFVKKIAASFDLKCFTQRIDVASLNRAPDENTLRLMRIGVVKALASQVGAAAIFFGHHREDLAETFLLQALRGAGPNGLEGMSVVRDIGGLCFIRPLLNHTKAQIKEALRMRGSTWREDSSNASPLYRRNRIRSEVLPLLEQINPGAISALGTSAEICGEMNEFYRDAVGGVEREAVLFRDEDVVVFSTKYLRELTKPTLLPGFFRTLVASLLPQGDAPTLPNRDFLRSVSARIEDKEADDAEFSLRGLHMRIDNRYGILHRESMGEADAWWRARGCLPMVFARNASEMKLQIEEREKGGSEMISHDSAGIDAGKITEPLTLVLPGPDGQIAIPGGSKSVRDCLKEAHVPRALRPYILAVASGEKLVWIPGVRQSVETLVGKSTRRVSIVRIRSAE